MANNTGNKALRDRLLAMDEAQVVAYWQGEQRAKRARGEHSYTTLVDPETGAVVATVEG